MKTWAANNFRTSPRIAIKNCTQNFFYFIHAVTTSRFDDSNYFRLVDRVIWNQHLAIAGEARSWFVISCYALPTIQAKSDRVRPDQIPPKRRSVSMGIPTPTKERQFLGEWWIAMHCRAPAKCGRRYTAVQSQSAREILPIYYFELVRAFPENNTLG